MNIVISNQLFSDFEVLDDLVLNENKSKVILNNNLILDKDFINTGHLAIRGQIIFNGGKLINSGNIYLIEKEKIEHILLFDIIGDNIFTGLILDRDIKDLVLMVSSPKSEAEGSKTYFKFKMGKENNFYFSNDEGMTAKEKIEKGDSLYWNETFSKIKLFATLKITLLVL